MAARAAKAAATGKKPKGRAPKPPGRPAAERRDQSHRRRVPDHAAVRGRLRAELQRAGRVVDKEFMLLVAHVTQATNDKQQLQPMLEKLQALPTGLKARDLGGDTGYYSEKNVNACQDAKIEPLIAVEREEHHPDWKQRFSEPQPLPEGATPVETMKHKLKTRAGKAAYALRKQTVEPVFGILKSVMGFRQFLLRGLENVKGEWSLVTMAWNLKRMFVLKAA